MEIVREMISVSRLWFSGSRNPNNLYSIMSDFVWSRSPDLNGHSTMSLEQRVIEMGFGL
jgi:hypothetical protein